MKKRILAVDNDRFMLEFMKELLTKQGHEVRTAQDGLSALEILKEYTPDIILLDLIMPNISGDRLCRVIRKNPSLKETYIVVVSATLVEGLGGFSVYGADACIAKGPLDKMSGQILAVIDQADRGPSALRGNGTPYPQPQDIHQRAITRELLSLQRHLEILLNNISEGILELNWEGKIIFANTVAISLFGVSEEKIIGERFAQLLEETDRKKVEGLLRNIGDGLPETIDPFQVQVHKETLSIKILPFEDDPNWSILVVAMPLRKIAPLQ